MRPSGVMFMRLGRFTLKRKARGSCKGLDGSWKHASNHELSISNLIEMKPPDLGAEEAVAPRIRDRNTYNSASTAIMAVERERIGENNSRVEALFEARWLVYRKADAQPKSNHTHSHCPLKGGEVARNMSAAPTSSSLRRLSEDTAVVMADNQLGFSCVEEEKKRSCVSVVGSFLSAYKAPPPKSPVLAASATFIRIGNSQRSCSIPVQDSIMTPPRAPDRIHS
ncbi:hypothetical protein K432DRAFT_55212 [Lepidopterella palustris CBS 459.81]|uniref:Uncharacterized protein n=1 Tax=Lepidopterella palustris CBS 459.81 TaxID=1314670 RepID=A0A8E2E9L0_9PEZI|nr:hypothetical protein K432DRAFT_55212 [Lepidopterella palustris CBS 459.81]